MNVINQFFHDLRERRRQAAGQRRERQLQREARKRINVSEYRGKVYLTIDDIPVLTDGKTMAALTDIVTEARTNFVNSRMSEADN